MGLKDLFITKEEREQSTKDLEAERIHNYNPEKVISKDGRYCVLYFSEYKGLCNHIEIISKMDKQGWILELVSVLETGEAEWLFQKKILETELFGR